MLGATTLHRTTRRTDGTERLRIFRGRADARPEVGKPFVLRDRRGRVMYRSSHVLQVSYDPRGFFTMNAHYRVSIGGTVLWRDDCDERCEICDKLFENCEGAATGCV